mmetsp:Transcript_61221/g.70149  ORF Transcript_61221/g.70149 Transcript_61221/m.70149 type:complete len:167 (+) Transcript_61221:110-610(+)
MSWQPYVDTQLMQKHGKTGSTTNVSEHAAIYGHNGTLWAASPGFSLATREVEVATEEGGSEQITMNEFENMANTFQNNGVCSKKGGLRINGVKCFLVRYDPMMKVAYLKKSQGGAAIAKTNRTFIVATFNQEKEATLPDGKKVPQNPGLTNTCVENLAIALTDADF